MRAALLPSSLVTLRWGAGCGLALLGACAASGTPVPATSDRPSGTNPVAAQAAAGTAPSPSATAAQGWVVSPKPDLRALTVVVRTNPPPALQSKYRELAARYRPLGPFFVANAEEAFGSGFVMVWREPTARLRAFIVTNRHVVGLASKVRVVLGGGGEAVPADVAYVDERYDLAVLTLSNPSQGEPSLAHVARDSGFALSDAPASDQDAVVASGYPGIGGKPSYQVTRGFVSNERFSLVDGGSEGLYIQHTAPIDSGSSGGPLMTPDGKVLGVNTLKIRGRENVALAVPAAVVASVLAQVATETPTSPAAEQARAACDALLGRLGASDSLAVERALGAELVADQGLASLGSLPPDDEWPGRFLDDPTEVFMRAIALRLEGAAAQRGPSARVAACEPDSATDTGETIFFKVQLGGSVRRLGFALEQGRWKLDRAPLGRAPGRSFLDGLERRRGPAKKWKPSMK